MSTPEPTGTTQPQNPLGSSELLDALSQATNAYLEEAMKGYEGTSPQWELALEALVLESFQAGFRSGVRHMEKQKASNAPDQRPGATKV